MGGIVMNKEVDAIMKTIEILFKRLDKTKYWLQISRDKYDKTFNIFFNSQHANDNLRSVRIHKIGYYNLEYLEAIVAKIHEQTQLTIEYVGFSELKWPSSQRLIQRKRETVE